MHKAAFLSGLGLALALSAGVAAAQSNTPQRAHGQNGAEMRRGGRGPEGFLLKGITLTADQQGRVADLRKQWGGARGEAMRKSGDQATRQKPTAEQRAAMQKQREQHIATLREILTPEQRTQFDANVAQMKERGQKRGGERHGAGER